MFLLGRQQGRLILKLLHFDLFRSCNFRCSRQASARHDHFVVNLRGNMEERKELIEKAEAGELCQNDQRRRISYSGRASTRSVDRRSSSRSS
jgi:hypothetical protein